MVRWPEGFESRRRGVRCGCEGQISGRPGRLRWARAKPRAGPARRPGPLRAGRGVRTAAGAGARARSVLGQAQGRAAYEEDHPCPDHVAGIVELDSGARAILEIGSLAPRHLDDGDFWQDVAVTVWGTHGFARVVLGAGWQAVTRGSGGRVQTGPADPSPGEPEHFRLLADWLDDPRRVHPSSLEISYHGFEILMGMGLASPEH